MAIDAGRICKACNGPAFVRVGESMLETGLVLLSCHGAVLESAVLPLLLYRYALLEYGVHPGVTNACFDMLA